MIKFHWLLLTSALAGPETPVRSSLSVSVHVCLLGLEENQGKSNLPVSIIQSTSWHPRCSFYPHLLAPDTYMHAYIYSNTHENISFCSRGYLGPSQRSLSETGTWPSFLFPSSFPEQTLSTQAQAQLSHKTGHNKWICHQFIF